MSRTTLLTGRTTLPLSRQNHIAGRTGVTGYLNSVLPGTVVVEVACGRLLPLTTVTGALVPGGLLAGNKKGERGNWGQPREKEKEISGRGKKNPRERGESREEGEDLTVEGSRRSTRR